MSRTKKGSKRPGHEYWSKRPGSNDHGSVTGEFSKNRTHRLERLEAKKAVKNRELDYCPSCDQRFVNLRDHCCLRCADYECECEC